VRRVLIVNRGEIALRAVRACRRLGLQSVAVHSSSDGNSPHAWAADHAVCIGPPPSPASYLNAAALIETAIAIKCDAVYPGYGFLSERSDFAAKCSEAGLTFVGPNEETIACMGDKVAARRTAASQGVPIVPGSECGFTDAAEAVSAAQEIRIAAGEPLSVKQSPANCRSAIEFRINAEDVDQGFRPSRGTLSRWRPPKERDIRIDTHVYEGHAIPPYYDSMLAKLIVTGPNRPATISAARSALVRFQVAGVATTIPFHERLLQRAEFERGEVHTRWVGQELQTVQ
jgi:acetyl/propionyl-CoA carboxylase alpha subunit